MRAKKKSSEKEINSSKEKSEKSERSKKQEKQNHVLWKQCWENCFEVDEKGEMTKQEIQQEIRQQETKYIKLLDKNFWLKSLCSTAKNLIVMKTKNGSIVKGIKKIEKK